MCQSNKWRFVKTTGWGFARPWGHAERSLDGVLDHESKERELWGLNHVWWRNSLHFWWWPVFAQYAKENHKTQFVIWITRQDRFHGKNPKEISGIESLITFKMPTIQSVIPSQVPRQRPTLITRD